MNIGVIGAGAIGGWVATRLALAGHKVMAVTSRGPLAELELSEGERVQRAAFDRFDSPADLLVLAVKAPALPLVASTLPHMISEQTIILPMLNGVPWWFVDGEPLRSVDPAGNIAAALPVAQ